MATAQTGAGDPKRSLELLWRDFETQPSKPGPKPRLTVERIVEAAIRVADRDGSCFGMREVAAELRVGTMTIYRYVPGKRELIDLMIDHLNGSPEDYPDPTGMGWRSLLEELAESTWKVYEEHPWVLEINQKRPVLGPRSLTGYDFILAAFEDHDMPDLEANLVITAVMSLVTGVAMSYMLRDSDDQGPVTTEQEWWEAQEPYLLKAVESGRYPRLEQTDEDAWNIKGYDVMRKGLESMLDGLAPRMEATRRTGRGTGSGP
ncbi:TetR/AcrR family transcriptional regulator [Glycomyces xiaoerkulensis]|uniref:TetR/AcrR family transcriptional regulator n=1 Tax=Glycomyces xiaoerkulensis TaxID=2038139 RepID=UPI000C2609C3|nr:TetR/AcrR family transcriptional regulator [Glycomyces xiaoerkulensis]